MALEFKIAPTLEELRKKHDKVAWTAYQHFMDCPARWFTNNFVTFVEADKAEQENTHAIAGWMIQKLLEVFIDKQVYLRGTMISMEDILRWFSEQTVALFRTIAFDVKGQHNRSKFGRARYFFRSNLGKEVHLKAIREWGLDPCIEGLQPHFLDEMYFDVVWGSRAGYIETIQSMFEPILETFLKYGLDLKRMLCEQYTYTTLVKGIAIKGTADFVYNVHQDRPGPLTNIKDLRDGFLVLDGKLKVKSYVKKEQLFFYATLLYLAHKKEPGKVGFIDWTRAAFSFFEYDPEYYYTLIEHFTELVEVSKGILDQLDAFEGDVAQVEKIEGLKWNASPSNCRFCTIHKLCPEAQRAGVKFEVPFYMRLQRNKRVAEKIKKSLDVTKRIQEIEM